MRKFEVVIRNPYEKITKEFTGEEREADKRLQNTPVNVRVFELERKVPDPKGKNGELLKDEKVLVKQVDLFTMCENCDGQGNLNGVDDCPFCDVEVRGMNHYKSYYDIFTPGEG